MILYFSGTGNSKYVAKSLSNLLGEETGFIPELDPASIDFEGKMLCFVFPIYSWGVPPGVMEFIGRLNGGFIGKLRSGAVPVVMVCTCGDETALAPEMFEKAFAAHGIGVAGAWSVIMPNNYVLLPGFDVDSPEVEQKKLDHAPSRIREIAGLISEGDFRRDVTVGRHAKFKTGWIYPLFKRYGINRKKWNVSEECVKCGKCVAACPVGNLKMKSGGYPMWGDQCVSCLACYHACPTKAISYGRRTSGKGQYFCHLHPLKSPDAKNPLPQKSPQK